MAQAEYVTNAVRALITGASAKPSTSRIRAVHVEFVPALAGHPPGPIPIDADALEEGLIDSEDRAHHLNKVFTALSLYVTAILDDTAQDIPSGLDLRHIRALLSDLASDVTGTIQLAAEGMAGRIA